MHNENGNDMQSVLDAFAAAKTKTGQGKPVVVLMKTEMGYGVDYMVGTHDWHGKAPNDALAEKALAQLEETLGDY
jgi:transketolase